MFAAKVVEERDELRYKLAGEAAHIKSLERLLVDAVRERDEALAQVARREREHEALFETAQKALAHVERERDEASQAFEHEKMARYGREMEAMEAADEARRERDEALAEVERVRAEWQRDLDGCNTIIDRLKARLGDK